jgi:hypothetical protein
MTNHANHDAALTIARTVGTNLNTLRKNKRNLAYNLVMATAVEGFGWTDVWADAKKAMGFAKLEKPEQNQINVLGTACKTIILAWPTLDAKLKADFSKGDIVFSTLSATIKEAEKAADKAAAEEQAKEDAAKEASDTPDPRDTPTVEPVVEASPNVAALQTVIAMLGQDTFASDETPLIVELLASVDALRQRILDASQQKAA